MPTGPPSEAARTRARSGASAAAASAIPDSQTAALQSERDRRRVLTEGAPDTGRGAILLRQAREGGNDRGEVVGDEPERLAHLQDERRVDNVLGGRATMEMRLQLFRQPRLDRLDEGDGRNAGERDLATEGGKVEVPGGHPLDRRCEFLRNQSKLRLGARQGGLDVKHRGDPAPVGKDGAHGVAREQRAEQLGIEGGEGHLNSTAAGSKGRPT